MNKLVFRLFLMLMMASDLCVFAQKPLSRAFTPYCDEITGLYGLQYGDEICIIPQYEEVKLPYIDRPRTNFAIDKPLYAFREGDKWGVASLYRTIIPPTFQDVAFFFNDYRLLMVKENGKWGLNSIEGRSVLECKYDTIYTILPVRETNWDKNKNKFVLPFENKYFIGQKEGKKLVFDVLDSQIGDENLAEKIFTALNKENNTELKKNLEVLLNLEVARHKQDEAYLTAVMSEVEKLKPLYDRVLTGPETMTIHFVNIDGIPYLVKGTYTKILEPNYKYEAFRDPSKYSSEEVINADVYYKFCKDGKWGLSDILGNVIIPAEYERIKMSGCGFEVALKRDTILDRSDLPFKWGLIDKEGNIKIPIKYHLLTRDESVLIAKMSGKDKHPDLYTLDGTFIGKTKKDREDADNKGLLSNRWLPASIRKDCEKFEQFKKIEPSGIVSYKVGDEYWCLLPNGLDLGILTYNDIDSRLARNPNSLIASVEAALEDVTGSNRLEVLQNSRILAEKLGYENSDFVRDLEAQYRSTSTGIAKEEAERRERERVERINAQIEAVSEAMQSGLSAVMNTYNIISGTKARSGSANSPGSSSIKRRSSSSKNSSGFSLSENQAYNTDKRTYAHYDSLLSAYFAGNRSASYQEVKQWKESMRNLRTKWENKGKTFPKSANEDR